MNVNFNGMPKSASVNNFAKPEAAKADKGDAICNQEERLVGETTKQDVDVLKVIRQTHTQNEDGTWSHSNQYGEDDGHFVDTYKLADGSEFVDRYHYEVRDGVTVKVPDPDPLL